MANKQKIKGAEALLLSLIAEGTDTIFGLSRRTGHSDLRSSVPSYRPAAPHPDASRTGRRTRGARLRPCDRQGGRLSGHLRSRRDESRHRNSRCDARLDADRLHHGAGSRRTARHGRVSGGRHVSMTMPISKWNYQVTKASEIPRAIARAYYIARTGRPGPVVIDISKNAQVEEFDFSYKPCIYLRSYHPKPELDKQAVARAVEMLNASEKPLILVGQGVKLAGAERRLVELAEAAGRADGLNADGHFGRAERAPAVRRQFGHARQHRRERDDTAERPDSGRRHALQRPCDGRREKLRPHAKIIHIDIDSAELGKNLPVELPIHADAGEALEAMKSDPGTRTARRVDVAKGLRPARIRGSRPPEQRPARAVYLDVRRDQHAGRGREGRRGDRHGRRPESDVQRPLLEIQLDAQFHHLRRARHDGASPAAALGPSSACPTARSSA